MWNSKQLSTNINVKADLLYGAENWRTTTTTIKKVQVFINSCLRKILNIHWRHQQQPFVGENKWHLEASPVGKRKRKKAKEHITSDNRYRCEKDELQLEGAGMDCPGQGWIDSAGERPMFLHEE
ncbi:unnamed protein product [Schistosoma mattheei]|uniref:Uncharacterized protein n=1 Tax=Schistosoma mattheei TaxID=31246 RepID=A0A183Q7H3_9TREM|nr:unnamed protein product [Schistosoma mattheei]